MTNPQSTWQRLTRWRVVMVWSYHAWVYHHDSVRGFAVLYPPRRWSRTTNHVVLLAHHSLFSETGEKVRICRAGKKPICRSNPELIYERPYVRLRNGVAVIARFDPMNAQKQYHAFTLLDPTRGPRLRREPDEWLIFVGPIEFQRPGYIVYGGDAKRRLVVDTRNVSALGTYQRAYIVFLLRDGEEVSLRVVRPDRGIVEIYTITAPPQPQLEPTEQPINF